jgi:hypothetical protein
MTAGSNGPGARRCGRTSCPLWLPDGHPFGRIATRRSIASSRLAGCRRPGPCRGDPRRQRRRTALLSHARSTSRSCAAIGERAGLASTVAIRRPAAASSRPRAAWWAPRCRHRSLDGAARAIALSCRSQACTMPAARRGGLLRVQRCGVPSNCCARASACAASRMSTSTRTTAMASIYAFESDPDVIFADMHEDGRHLYPGTGGEHETAARRPRQGTKLNIPLPPGADDDAFAATGREVICALERRPRVHHPAVWGRQPRRAIRSPT